MTRLSNRRIKIAMLIPDNRDEFRRFCIPGPQPFFGPAPEALLEGLRQFPEFIDVHLISCTHDPLEVSQSQVGNMYFHSIVVPSWGWRTLYSGCVLSIRRLLRDISPDLVHGQGTERYCGLAAACSGYPNIVTLHGNMRSLANGMKASCYSYHGVTAHLESLTLRRTLGVVCNSSYTEAQVQSIARQTWRIPNAIRSFIFSSPLIPSPRKGHPRLLNIGNIVSYKRQLELLNWAGQLHASGHTFTLDFIGSARRHSYSEAFHEAIAKAEPLGYARYLGERHGEALIKEMDTADALIHVPTEESFGLVAAEALSRNLKLFVSRTGGLVDIASGVDGAELFDVNDWNGLGEAVTHWLNAGAPRPDNSSAIMKQRYHPTVIAQAHIDLYKHFLRQ